MSTALLELVTRLRLPAQDQAALSFCASTSARSLATWASQLPAPRTNQTSVLLYQALPEICRLQTSASNRLEILEHLRPYVQHCIQGLAKAFLDQPLIMPESAVKTAIIAQALQKHMSNGYSLVVRELAEKHPDGRFRKDERTALFGLAIHRAITGLGLQLLRNLQIYTPVSSQFWLELHTLYLLAEKTSLLRQPYADPLLKQQPATTIGQAYARVVLLWCTHANQLRQQEVSQIYEALESWSGLVQLAPGFNCDRNPFGVDLQGNRPPRYKSHLLRDGQPETGMAHEVYELQVAPLLDVLRRIVDQGPSANDPITVPAGFSSRLIRHLLSAWGEEQQRYQPRKPAQNTLEIAVGLNCVHYHLADGQTFEEFLWEGCQIRRRTSKRFRLPGLGASYDPWDDAFDAEKQQHPSYDHILKTDTVRTEEPAADKHPLYRIRISDISPGGYGLTWEQDIPAQVKAGELMALREFGEAHWSLGIIRWVKQHKGKSQLGIQLIAREAQAIAIQQLQKTGQDNVHMRGLISSRAGTNFSEQALVTAQHPFRVHNRVRISQNGSTTQAQLTELLSSSPSINLFAYQTTAGPVSLRDEPIDDAFPSRW